MDLELLQSARQSLSQQSLGASNGTAWGQMCDVSMRGLPGVAAPSVMARQQPLDMSQGGAGFNLSQSAMLVGTVAALKEESGQLRTQWKSDVSRLESELGQLRAAAAWALPHLSEAQNAEPSLRLMQGAAMERSSSTGNLNAAQLERAMMQMQGALGDRLSQERGLDALLAHGTGSERGTPMLGERTPMLGQRSPMLGERGGGLNAREAAQIEAAMMQGAANERAAQAAQLEALLRQNALAERGGSSCSGLLAREAAQLDAAMMHGAVPERASRDRADMLMMQRNSSTGNLRDASGLADALKTQMSAANDHAASSTAASERGRPMSSYNDQTSMEQAKVQMMELYKELEKITVTLQDAQQENRKIKEDKEASETAHARDVAALEGMLQQLGADNDRLTQALAKAEEKLAQRKVTNPGTPSSIRSASREPAMEPDVEQAEIDRIRFKIGMSGHR